MWLSKRLRIWLHQNNYCDALKAKKIPTFLHHILSHSLNFKKQAHLIVRLHGSFPRGLFQRIQNALVYIFKSPIAHHQDGISAACLCCYAFDNLLR